MANGSRARGKVSRSLRASEGKMQGGSGKVQAFKARFSLILLCLYFETADMTYGVGCGQ
jgi:hypothetical protein